MVMTFFVAKENFLDQTRGECRVSLTPDSVKRLAKQRDVVVETMAGAAAGFPDSAYVDAGARIVSSLNDIHTIDKKTSLCVLSVSLPLALSQWDAFPPETTFIGTFGVLSGDQTILSAPWRKQTIYSLDLIPRISRAQSMDVLSSQANMGGYRAVLEAAAVYGRSFPMMMTAAGTVPPAKVLILGAGVAGLQAIATAKRLGAVVSAFDVRPAVKEQVESLGACFVEVAADADESERAGYAKEMSSDYKKRQAEKIAQAVAKSDIVITTALIPGKPAPRLISKEMVAAMNPGSIIVDMATRFGGNCEGSKPDEVVVRNGVHIIGYTNLPSRLAQSCSMLYAKNVFNFLQLMWDKDTESFTNTDDEIVKAATVVRDGRVEYKRDTH